MVTFKKFLIESEQKIEVGDLVKFHYYYGEPNNKISRVSRIYIPSRAERADKIYNFDIYYMVDDSDRAINPECIELYKKGPFTQEQFKSMSGILDI